MKTTSKKDNLKALSISVGFILSTCASSITYSEIETFVKHVRGHTVTGVNNVKGKPFFDWGGSAGTFNFPNVFAHNSLGSEPLMIDETTTDNTILATGVHPTFLSLSGQSSEVVDPSWINVKMRDIPVNIDFSLTESRPLRGIHVAQNIEVAQSEPAEDITLGQWMKASSVARIVCSNNTADVKLRFKDMIPNRMYSAWASMEVPQPVDAPVPAVFPLPLGGAPNVFMTDKNGDATYERHLNFCPYDETASNRLMTINIIYHADHQNYGAVPSGGFIPGEWLGVIAFSHILFPINVELLRP